MTLVHLYSLAEFGHCLLPSVYYLARWIVLSGSVQLCGLLRNSAGDIDVVNGHFSI